MSAVQARSTVWRRLTSQPLTGTVAAAAGLVLTFGAWLAAPPSLNPQLGLLILLLLASLQLSYQFPIHIRYVTKIYMGSLPLYLIAVLLPPPIAATVAGLGLAWGELGVQGKKGTYYSDIACQAGRWMVVSLAGSVIAHLPLSGYPAHIGLLVACALALQAGDIITAPLSIVPLTGEHPGHIIVECAREVGLPEAGQYFMGFLGALLAMHDVWAVSLLILPLALVYRVAKRAKEMHDTTRRMLESMADSVDERDPFTHYHSIRVAELTRQLLKELNVVGPEAELIVTAARVHDVGKIAVPEAILLKREVLTSQDWNVIETHPKVGADMLVHYPAFSRGADFVRGHHERWDGAGYPGKLARTDIPFGARIIAVADAFDAMTSDRPYRAGMPLETAATLLRSGSGIQWEPRIVDALLQVIARRLQQRSPAGLRVERASQTIPSRG